MSRSPGDAPPPRAIVVREGKRRVPEEVVRSAKDRARKREVAGTWDGFYRVSVAAAEQDAGETLLQFVQRIVGQYRVVKWFRLERPGALLSAGFAVEASAPEPYHYDVVLGTTVDSSIVTAFDDCFGAEVQNELWRQRS